MTMDTCPTHQYTELDEDGECPTCKALGSSAGSVYDVVPQAGDLLCRRTYGAWGYSGDKFSHFEGETIVAKQTFASGEIRHSRGDDRTFRVLRDGKLYRVIAQNS